MITKIIYNVLPIIMCGALGYGLGKTIQIMRAAKAAPELYTAPNPTWIQQASPIWMMVAAVVIAVIAIRYFIKRNYSGGNRK